MPRNYYQQCNSYMGRCVEVRTRDGLTHRGFIRRVEPNHVYIQPIGRRGGGFPSGRYYRPYQNNWYGIGLGFITGLALSSFLF